MADNCTIVAEGETVADQTDEVAALRASRRRLVLAGDAERRAIERALHDGLQQQLVGLAADLELASASIESDPEAAKRHLAEVRRGLRAALEEARTLAYRIHPALDAGGLGPALRLAAAGGNVPARIDVTVGTSLPREIAGAAYFCCVELLERVDGAATTITIDERDDGLVFEVVAEGAIDRAGSSVRDRVEALGGTFDVRSDPGPRTVWSGFLPVP